MAPPPPQAAPKPLITTLPPRYRTAAGEREGRWEIPALGRMAQIQLGSDTLGSDDDEHQRHGRDQAGLARYRASQYD